MRTTGVIYVKVRIKLEANVDEQEMDTIVQNMDYNFSHIMIQGTEVVEQEGNFDNVDENA